MYGRKLFVDGKLFFSFLEIYLKIFNLWEKVYCNTHFPPLTFLSYIMIEKEPGTILYYYAKSPPNL